MDLLFETTDSNSSLIAGTLPSVLRRLTNVSSGSQFEAWALLASIREYSSARYVFDFLKERYDLTSESVERMQRATRATMRMSSTRSADHGNSGSLIVSDLQRHALGPELLLASHKANRVLGQFGDSPPPSHSSSRREAVSTGAESLTPDPEFASETFVEIKLGVLLFLETWLSCFPEDFMGTPQDSARASMCEVDASAKERYREKLAGGQTASQPVDSCAGADNAAVDDWDDEDEPDTSLNENATKVPSVGNGGSQIKEPDSASNSFRRDSLSYLIDFIKSSFLSCPFLPLLGVNFKNSRLITSGILNNRLLFKGEPFQKFFPCIYKVANMIDEDISRETAVLRASLSTAESSGRTDGPPASSDRGDGFTRSIIPMASVVCSLNARSKLKRIPIPAMRKYYDRSVIGDSYVPEEASVRLLTPLRLDGSVDTNFTTVNGSHLAMRRQRSDDFNSSATFIPWHESEALQTSKLRSAIIETLANHYMEPFRLVMQQYSRVAAALRSAEMIAAEDETIFAVTDIPIKVFVTPIDKHFLTYNYSTTRGFNPVAANMASLKHMHGTSASTRALDTSDGAPMSPPKEASKLVSVNLNEVLRTGVTLDDTDDADGSDAVERSNGSEVGVIPGSNNSGRDALIVLDDDLAEALYQQMIDDQIFTLRPFQIWKRRQRRFELERRLKQWREDNNIPGGIDNTLFNSPNGAGVKLTFDARNQSLLLQFAPSLLTYHFTLKLHYLFSTIPMLEFLVHAGFSERSRREVPMLARFRVECDRMQEFLVSEILAEDEAEIRAKIIVHLVQMAEAAAQCWSHHLLMLIVQALQCHPVHRLRNTWKFVDRIIPGRWQRLQEKVGFGGSSLLTLQMNRFIEQGMKPDKRLSMYLHAPHEAVGAILDSSNAASRLYLSHLERTVALGEAAGVLSCDTAKQSSDEVLSFNKPESRRYRIGINPEAKMIGGIGFDKADGENDLSQDFSSPSEVAEDRSSATSAEGGGGEKNTGDVEAEGEDYEPHRAPFAPQWDGELRGSSFTYRRNVDENDAIGVSSPASAGFTAAGIVRERNPDSRQVFLGLPRVAPEAGMPYVPGVISKLIRLNELPEYLRDPEDPNEMLFVLSPGVLPDDQRLPMVNMGKLRSVARWLMLLRSAQLAPYKYDEKAINKDIFARLMKPPAYAGHDAQWERSVALEKKA